MTTLDQFRQKLEEATNKSHPREHGKNVDELRDIYPHNIVCISNPLSTDNLMPRIYNPTEDCFIYVFKDILSPEMLKSFLDAYERNEKLDSRIEYRLISEGFIDLHKGQNENDIVIVYFNNSNPAHFAKIANNIITSKWGRGNVWRHGLWEVPLSYGDEVMYSNGRIKESIFEEVIRTIV